MNNEDKREIQELTHRETKLLLKVTPLEMMFEKMNSEEISAVQHYVNCKECRDQGLAEILDKQLSCQEAILIWANRLGSIYHQTKTLLEEYAVEHVWGKYEWKNQQGGHGYDLFNSCKKHPCHSLQSYWQNVPMSSSYDGASGVINEFPFFIKLFNSEGWHLGELLVIQRKRISEVLRDLRNGRVTVSPGHYKDSDELVSELEEHVIALQNLYEPSMVRTNVE